MNRFESQIVNNNGKNKIPDRLFSPLWGVTLGNGLFLRVFDNNRRFLQKIDLDAALYWFRKKAGRNAPGQPYRGHFEDNIKGQTAGMLLMGAGNALRWTEDPALTKLVNTIVDEIADSSEDDGYLMAVPREQFGTLEYPHYVRIWLSYGLYAAALGGNPKALSMLRRWQDWFNNCDDLPIIKYLTLAFQGVVASPFVFNTAIGKTKDIETTIQYYEEDWRLGQFIMREDRAIETRKQPGVEPHPHGTELEALEGYLDLYRATGKHYYLRAVLNAYEMYKRDWQHVGGGIVMCEFLHTNAYPGCNWLSPTKPYNELCCSSFWILLNQRLQRLYPDNESYTAEIEKSLYNIAIANQDNDTGIRYFAYIDKHKQDGGLVHCCCGVGTRLYSILPEFLYSVTAEEDEAPALAVNLYNESEFVWERKTGNVEVKTITRMPYGQKVDIEICGKGTGKQRFSLRLRIPAWTVGPVTVTVDKNRTYRGQQGTYLAITEDWSGRHHVEFELPFAWKRSKYSGAEEFHDDRAEPPLRCERWAYEYGPLLMALCGEVPSGEYEYQKDPRIMLRLDPEDNLSWMLKTETPLHFTVKDHPYTVAPYFELGSREPFTCYPCFYP